MKVLQTYGKRAFFTVWALEQHFVHSSSYGSYRAVNRVPLTSGDLRQPYFTSTSLIVANTTTPNLGSQPRPTEL